MRKTRDLPPAVLSQIAAFGNNLKVSRIRRGETQDQVADRLGVTRQTIAQMEEGSPKVIFENYALALWNIGMSEDLTELADPDRDIQGKVAERERDPERVRAEKAESDNIRERLNF